MSSKPFLKWPGGKYRLVERINKELGPGKRLIEPFIGSGAVFLNSPYNKFLLADNNPDLINLYNILHQEGGVFIEYVRGFFLPECNNADAYYSFRAVFNNTNDIRLKAALFIYLNRHCYNGLCRYNSSGGFNSPFGRYKTPHFPEQTMLAFMEKSKHAKFISADFKTTMMKARKGDVIYCDPPYTPLSKTANFTGYSTGGFGWDKQEELVALALKLASKGIRVVISNHNTPDIRKLYKEAKITSFQVQRYISQDTNNRKKAAELIAVFDDAEN